MKKVMWILSFLSLIGTAVVLQFLPERVPMHFDIAGNIDRWGSKYENLVFPVIILALSLFWTLFIRYYEKKSRTAADEKERAGAKTNTKVLCVAGLLMAAMFTVMQGSILYGAWKASAPGTAEQAVDIGKISVILMGIVFIVLGSYMTKTRINRTVGLRVSWSMYNDNTWRKSNRFGAFALMAAGVLTVVLAVLVKNSFAAAMASLGAVLIAAAVSVMYAHSVYLREIKAEKGVE